MDTGTQNNFDHSHLDSWIATEIAEGRMGGCAVEVVSQGVTVHQESHGNRGFGQEPITFETQFWIASMTKPVVSLVVMHLVEAGWLNLDDPVSDFIPGFGGSGVLAEDGTTVPVSRPATVRDLLIHTAGITYGQFGDGPLHRMYAEAHVYDFSVTNKVMSERLAALPLMQQPGTCFEYGMSTDLLGRVIEVVTGDPLDVALRMIVFGPLGMHDTGFVPNASRVAHIPDCDIKKKIPPDLTARPNWCSGGAGLFSTVPDYIRFARMLRGKGSLGSSAAECRIGR